MLALRNHTDFSLAQFWTLEIACFRTISDFYIPKYQQRLFWQKSRQNASRTGFHAISATLRLIRCKSDPMMPHPIPQRVSSSLNAAAYAHSPAQGSAAAPTPALPAFALP